MFMTFAQCASFDYLVVVITTGWGMIFGGAFFFFSATVRPLQHAVDHSFLELERQAQTGEVGPRVLEPFIAMAMEVTEDTTKLLEECTATVPRKCFCVLFDFVPII